jgi:hypothetical protein
VIGIICGIATSRVLSIYANWPTLISISSIAIAFLFSAAVGVFLGFIQRAKPPRSTPSKRSATNETNDEARMSNDEGMSKPERRSVIQSPIPSGFRHSNLIRHSSFGFRHSCEVVLIRVD